MLLSDFNFETDILYLFAIDQSESPLCTLYVVAPSACVAATAATALLPMTVAMIFFCTFDKPP